MLHLGHFLQDIMTQYAQSRPWILVSSTYASSAMPQKRNPGSLIDIRRDASQVLSETQSEVWRLHNLMPGMYDGKDLAITGELFEDACQVMDAFGKVLALLKIDASRALEELNSDWTASQELADILMRRFAIPFRIGHRFASSLVSFARTNQFTPKNIQRNKPKSRVWLPPFHYLRMRFLPHWIRFISLASGKRKVVRS